MRDRKGKRQSMTLSTFDDHTVDDLHPIDIVQDIATRHAWQFSRLADDQIAMSLEGQWRSYDLTLAWSAQAEVLRLACSFDMSPPDNRLDAVHHVMNLANEKIWEGGFSLWQAQRKMVWRYGLVLAGNAFAQPTQVDRMIARALEACEQFYPAFQLAAWGDTPPDKAIGVAIGAPFGRA